MHPILAEMKNVNVLSPKFGTLSNKLYFCNDYNHF